MRIRLLGNKPAVFITFSRLVEEVWSIVPFDMNK